MGSTSSRHCAGAAASQPPDTTDADGVAVFPENMIPRMPQKVLRHHKPLNLQDSTPEMDVRFVACVYLCASTRGVLAAALRNLCADELMIKPGQSVAATLQKLGVHVTTSPQCYQALPFKALAAIDTPAEQVVTHELGRLADRLVDDGFACADCGHAHVIIGPRGSGKSVALQRFTLTAPVMFPSLRVVYIDAAQMHGGHPMYGELASFILSLGLGQEDASEPAQAAHSLDWESSSPANYVRNLARLTAMLEAAGIHLMVIIDEAETLYTARDAAVHMLVHELSAFATSTKVDGSRSPSAAPRASCTPSSRAAVAYRPMRNRMSAGWLRHRLLVTRSQI